jgi:hypothetical protein
MNMKKVFLISLLLAICGLCFGQSRRTPPNSNFTVCAIIKQSVSYLSYIGETDDTEEWYDLRDIETVLGIDNMMMRKLTVQSNPDFISNFETFFTLAKPIVSERGDYFENNLNDFWHSNDRRENLKPEEKDSFGFSIQGENNIKFHIDIYPNKAYIHNNGAFDSTTEEVWADSDYGYHYQTEGRLFGTTVITVEKNGEKVWVFYYVNTII